MWSQAEAHAQFGPWQKGYGTIVGTVARAPLSSVHWDEATSTPWTEYVDPHAPAAPAPGERGQISQLWFDDARSLALKYDAAAAEGVRGIAMWTADAFHDGPCGHVASQLVLYKLRQLVP